jgi:hypothetical protein
LSGQGFTNQTKVQLIGSYSSTVIPQYFSPDGKMIMFFAPGYLSPSQYVVSVYNEYLSSGILATSSPSNNVTLQVIQAAAQ